MGWGLVWACASSDWPVIRIIPCRLNGAVEACLEKDRHIVTQRDLTIEFHCTQKHKEKNQTNRLQTDQSCGSSLASHVSHVSLECDITPGTWHDLHIFCPTIPENRQQWQRSDGTDFICQRKTKKKRNTLNTT